MLTVSSHFAQGTGEEKEVIMGLIDWLRGGRASTPPDSQEERIEMLNERDADEPELPETLDEKIALEHDEEAARHRGM